MSIRVLVADDEELVRTGFRLVLDREPDIAVIGEAPDGASAAALAERLAPDVVLMDIRMPELDGLEATRRIVAATGARVVILTTFDEDAYVYDALRAGASGFLLKYAPAEDLLRAIRVVAAGEAILAPTVTRRLLATFAGNSHDPGAVAGVASLTAREREVLRFSARSVQHQDRRRADHQPRHGQDARGEPARQARVARPCPSRRARLPIGSHAGPALSLTHPEAPPPAQQPRSR